MNTKLVDSLVQIILSLSQEERTLLEKNALNIGRVAFLAVFLYLLKISISFSSVELLFFDLSDRITSERFCLSNVSAIATNTLK